MNFTRSYDKAAELLENARVDLCSVFADPDCDRGQRSAAIDRFLAAKPGIHCEDYRSWIDYWAFQYKMWIDVAADEFSPNYCGRKMQDSYVSC